MRKIEINCKSFGDKNKFPVIIRLVNELKRSEYKHYTRCISLIQKYYICLNSVNQYTNQGKMKAYLYNLIKKDFLSKLELSNIHSTIPKDVYSCMRNLIVGIYRNKMELINLKENNLYDWIN